VSVLHPPPNSIAYDELEFVKLGQQDLTSFDCTENGNDEHGLQTFIQTEAQSFQNSNLGVTYLVSYDGKIVAFLTVAMAGISVSRIRAEEKMEGVEIKNYPALLLGRLAVDKGFWNKDVGSYVCRWCLGLARRLSQEVGCRCLALHAHHTVISFYTKNGFVVSEAETGPTRLLYRKIA